MVKVVVYVQVVFDFFLGFACNSISFLFLADTTAKERLEHNTKTLAACKIDAFT